MQMKISVVMATYNGVKYLREQLESLKNQTKKIDEVLILDDGSKDGSVSLIKDYIESNRLEYWKLIENNSNVGWKANFIRGFELATGDLIFPCDQDDVWHLDKIEIMSKVMEQNLNIYVLEGQSHSWFMDYVQVVDANKLSVYRHFRMNIGLWLDKQNARRNKCKNTKMIYAKGIDSSFLKNAPGCALCVRKDFFEKIKGEWFEDLAHDALVSLYAKILGHYFVLDWEVIEWRKHIGSATRPAEKTKKNRIAQIDLDKKMISRVKKYAETNNVNNNFMETIQKAEKWNKLRKDLVESRKLSNCINLLFYREFYVQFRRYFTDFKYGIEKNEKND